MKVGIIGCGNISRIYFKNLTSGLWPHVELVACADLDVKRAEEYQKQYPQVKAMSVNELIGSKEVELVINLTIPQAHYPVAMDCIASGKHHYSEKPMAVTSEEAKRIIKAAEEKGVRAGCAPDTFLGSGIQTAIEAVKKGALGQAVSVSAHMMCRGYESWHPAPEFYYLKGGGPLMDMGPYYLTAMISMFGKVKSVKAFNKATFETRTIKSEPLNGKVIPVEVPTHNTALLEFESGVIGTLVTSFDVMKTGFQPIVVGGTDASMMVPDPNTFGGDVVLKRNGAEDETLPPINEMSGNTRGVGVADMVQAIESGEEHKASGELAAHVLEVMEWILEE